MVNRKAKHNKSLKVAVQGPDFMAHPYTHTHTHMRTYIHKVLQYDNDCL
jgi:hypothetical protein